MRVLFVGSLHSGSNARSFCDAFLDAGHDLRAIDTNTWPTPRFGREWTFRRQHGQFSPAAGNWMTDQISQRIQAWAPDLLFCFRPVYFPNDVFHLPRTRLVHYSPDDVSNPDNTSPTYLEHEKQWDLIITTKRHNEPELARRGASRVHFMYSAYDRRIHYKDPSIDFGHRRYLVGFVGAARQDRADLPRIIARAHPGQAVVAGPRWRRQYPMGLRGLSLRGNLRGHELSRLGNQIQCGLVVLNSANRDTHTCRTFETPACGQLPIMQRTIEHSSLFDEGTEALFIDSLNEAVELTRRASLEPAWAEKIAGAAHRRLMASGHSYNDRVSEIEQLQ